MNQFKKVALSCVVMLLAGMNAKATTRKVLFIGNSYTYTNNMPLMLQTLTTALGDTLVYDESDPGGYTFMQHSAYAPTITKIFSQKWDIVVLQDQSEEPSFPPAQVATDVYPYAHVLDSMIHANDSCTQTMFMMTWGHANGDPANCGSYPVICTYEGMQLRLRESYMQMTQDNKAVVAPVGAAWKVAHDSVVTPWLYISDSSHPLPAGSYLESCVLYSSIFHKRTSGASYTSGLTTADARLLQRIADRVTMDSLRQWQQYGHYPSAAFDYTQSGATITFTHYAAGTAQYAWDYGDGYMDTTADPIHHYAANGTYTVAHTASDTCFTETITRTLHIGATTGVADPAKPIVTIAQQGNGRILMTMTEPGEAKAELYDAAGRRVTAFTLAHGVNGKTLIPGFYLLKVTDERQNTGYYKVTIY